MKKLLLVLVMVLAYTFSYAEDYQPDQIGKNFDIKFVDINAEVIDPITGELSYSATAINDVIVGTVRTWELTDNSGPYTLLTIGAAANKSYELTFQTTYSGEGLDVKGKWFDNGTELVSPATLSGSKSIEFIAYEVDATNATVGAKQVKVNVSIVYLNI